MEKIKEVEEWLDERYIIIDMTNKRSQDVCYYNGALKMLEKLGYDLIRNDSGKHKIFKNR